MGVRGPRARTCEAALTVRGPTREGEGFLPATCPFNSLLGPEHFFSVCWEVTLGMKAAEETSDVMLCRANGPLLKAAKGTETIRH